MTKYTPIKLTQLSANESAAVDAINKNLDSIKEHIDDSVSRSAKSPSQMQADLDMNGHKILNISAPVADTDLVRLKDVVENKEEIKTMVNAASVAVEKAMEAAETAESAAEDMADQIQLAKDWATKTTGPVDGNEYSSKYYAEQIGADVHTVADIAEDVSVVADNATNINSVAGDLTNVNSVAGGLTNIDAAASNETNINTVAANISDVNNCAANMTAIQGASTQASNAASSAQAAAASATEASISAAGTHFKLFNHCWFDYQLNDLSWLCADTFTWHDGTVYSNAYNHLVDDYENGQTATNYYGWETSDILPSPPFTNEYALTLSATPEEDDVVYDDAFGEIGTVVSLSGTTMVIKDSSDNTYTYTRNSTKDTSVGLSDTIGSYTITYTLAQDGHKIVTPDQAGIVQDIFEESGVAWYYILDTTNQRFKLPRTKYGFVGLRDAVGKYVPESLPNHMHYVSRSADISKESVELEDGGSHDTVSRNANLNTSYLAPTTLASYNNSVYQDNAPVQERATQMYLYFYVGQFTQSATEQTAGLNAETLNGKMDNDRIQEVSVLPANPQEGILYLIPE